MLSEQKWALLPPLKGEGEGEGGIVISWLPPYLSFTHLALLPGEIRTIVFPPPRNPKRLQFQTNSQSLKMPK